MPRRAGDAAGAASTGSRDVNKQIKVFGAVKNLTDERSIAGLRQGIYAGPERAVEVGARFTFRAVPFCIGPKWADASQGAPSQCQGFRGLVPHPPYRVHRVGQVACAAQKESDTAVRLTRCQHDLLRCGRQLRDHSGIAPRLNY